MSEPHEQPETAADLHAAAPVDFPAPAPAEDEENLEFKPAVIYTAAGLLACAAIGLLASFYWLGHRQGFAAGIASEQVAEKLNHTAAANLNRFMQLNAADDAELQTLAAAPEAGFAWIQDAAIRREAQWQLACILLSRGMADSAEPLLKKLFSDAPQEALWAHRAAETGDSLLPAHAAQEAAEWYRRAANDFAALGKGAENLTALEHYFAALGATPQGFARPEAAEALLKETENRPEARALRAALRLHLALLYRGRGDETAAVAALRSVTDALAPGNAPAADLTPAEQVCCGTAYAEQGNIEAALPLLTQGEARLGRSTTDALWRLMALRRTASALMQQSGDVNGALSQLHRAEGLADHLLPADHAFHACLAEQRGWLLLLSQDEEAALASFTRAADAPHDAVTAMQAMEGAGRCLLALNRAEEAEKVLQRCAALRGKQAPADKAGAGRVTLLLAQALDHRGQTAEAAGLYGKAAQLLTEAGEAESANLLTALLGCGYAMEQLHRWNEGREVWERITPLVKDIPDRREEARTHLNECRRHSHLPSVVASHDMQATAEAAAADAAAEAEEAEDDDEEESAAKAP